VNAAERVVRRVDALQQKNKVAGFVFGVSKKFGDDNAGVLVSNLAFSAFLALFPLLLILVTVLGIVLAGYPSLQQSVLHSTFAQFPVVGSDLSGSIHALKRGSVFGLAVGLVGLAWGSLGISQAGLFAMAQVWNLPGPDRLNYVKRLGRSVAFIGVLGSGLIVSTFLASYGTFGRHEFWLGIGGEILAAAANVGQYLLAFRVLTPKHVVTRDLVPGAIAGGVAWTILQAVGGYLIGHDLRNDNAIYGSFASVLGLLVWVYLGCRVTIYAAELNTVVKRRLWPRSITQPPYTDADRRALALQAVQMKRARHETVEVTFADEAEPERSGAKTGT
jgi:YihY family inner membrane protein